MSSFIFSSFIPRLFTEGVDMRTGYSLMLLNSVPTNTTTTFVGATNGTNPAPTVNANIVIENPSGGTIIRPRNSTYIFAQNSNITALGVLLYKQGPNGTVEFPVAYFHFGQAHTSINGDFSVTIPQFITVS